MHSSLVAALTILATDASAAPTNPSLGRAALAIFTVPCVVALVPSFSACAPAVDAQGANTPFNTACLVAAAKGAAPFPTSCSPCAAPFGVTDPGTQVTPTQPIIGSATPANQAQGNTPANHKRAGPPPPSKGSPALPPPPKSKSPAPAAPPHKRTPPGPPSVKALAEGSAPPAPKSTTTVPPQPIDVPAPAAAPAFVPAAGHRATRLRHPRHVL
ncbi:hypothetical protein DFH09DRAFT_1084621 [Mycena vulgaris]|nr:hypothetical protein DFH09DRAFT_1084621 [Mycena vulgaris]